MSQNLQIFTKFQNFQLDNLVDFEKCCKTPIYLQKSVPIQPKTSNSLPKFCKNEQQFAEPAEPRLRAASCEGRPADGQDDGMVREGSDGRGGEGRGELAKFCRIFTNFCKFSAGSFSAVSKRNFARKYAFDSIFQSLQDLHTFAPLQAQNCSKTSLCEKSANFS